MLEGIIEQKMIKCRTNGRDKSRTDSQTFSVTYKVNRTWYGSTLCLGSLLVLDGSLLQVLGNISGGVLLLGELGGRGSRAVNGLVLLCGLAGGVCGAVGACILLGLKALDFLLSLLDVLRLD
jgi:hypothetical protein